MIVIVRRRCEYRVKPGDLELGDDVFRCATSALPDRLLDLVLMHVGVRGEPIGLVTAEDFVPLHAGSGAASR